MSWIWTILIGFVAGLLARFLMPGKDAMGFIMTTVLGIAGSLLATFIGSKVGLFQEGGIGGFIGAVLGALLLLVIYRFIKKN